jgi:hypothetical protein
VAVLTTIAMIGALAVVAGSAPIPAYADVVDPVPLGAAATFAVLTPAAVGNTATGPVTTLRGDLGAGGGTTGFPPGVYTGTLYTGAAVNPAVADVTTAYADAQGRPAGTALAGDLIGVTVGPGVHTNVGAVANTGTFTIDAGGGAGAADAVFIFQVGGALAMAAGSHVVLAGGAQAKNVYWQVNGAGAVGANATFVGTLIASAAIDVGANTIFNGRALSTAGAITLNSNEIYSAPPVVAITSPASATTTTPTITGTTSVISPVTVTIAGQPSPFTVTPTSGGVWSLTSPLLANGTYTVDASVTDGAANVGTATQQLTIDTVLPVVTIDGGPTALTNDLTPTISGTTDIAPGQVVTVTATLAATTITRTALVQADLTYDLTPTLTAGTWAIAARVTDPAGNVGTTTQSLVIDTTGPTATINGGANALTNVSTPAISGTADGVTVTVTIDGQNAPGVVIAGANWSVPYPGSSSGLADGAHHISVDARDPAGNTTTVAQTLTVDTVAPIIVIAPGATYSTNDTTPTIAGTTDVPAGSGVTVNVTIDGTGPGGNATVQVDGTWNITPGSGLAAGSHTIVATIADAATNVGTATETVIIDIVAPVVTIDGGASRTTADATPTITGHSADVAVGSSVTIAVAGQSLTAIVDGAGNFTTTAATIVNGNHSILVTVIDPAGNPGSAVQSLTVNAVAPTVTIDFGGTHTTNDDTPLIGGTTSAAAGSAVTVTVDGQTLAAIVQPGGSWNVTAAHIENSDVNVTVTIVDADGNSGAASQTLTVDSTAATPIVITGGAARSTNDDTPAISGLTGAADGRIITVAVNGQTLTVAALGGAWGVNATHLNDGTYSVGVSVSSSGGNPGAATQQLTIDTVAPVVVLSGGPNLATTDPTPTITGTGTPGSTVTVTVAGQTLTTTIGSDGTWSVTPVELSPGPHAVVVTITDPAGNTGTGT